MRSHVGHDRPPPIPASAGPAGARFSSASAGLLTGVVAAVLATIYGARGSPVDELSLEVLFAAAVAAVTVGLVPTTLALTVRRAGLVTFTIGLLSAGAAAIHYAVIRDHFDEYWGYGLFFIGMGLFQLFWATAVVVRPARLLLVLGLFANLAIVASWIVTRTVGLLIGPSADEVESVGLADGVATGFEVVIVAGALFLLVRHEISVRARPRRTEALTWMLWLLVAAGTTLGLLSAVGAASGSLPPAT